MAPNLVFEDIGTGGNQRKMRSWFNIFHLSFHAKIPVVA